MAEIEPTPHPHKVLVEKLEQLGVDPSIAARILQGATEEQIALIRAIVTSSVEVDFALRELLVVRGVQVKTDRKHASTGKPP
jgi:hypothetical protein